VAYLLRLLLPDRPGTLGEVAGALGAAGIDILALDVVEHADGRAVDEMVLNLPAGLMPDSAVSACTAVAGVTVEFVTPYPAGAPLSRDLEVLEQLAADPARAEHVLAEAVPDLFRLAWGVVVRVVDGCGEVEHASLGAPADGRLPTPWLPLSRAERVEVAGSSSSAWTGVLAAAAPLAGRDRALVIGRYGGPQVLDSEVARLGYLATLAATLSTTATASARAPGAATAVALDHLVLSVGDVERSAGWYGEVLGMQAVTFGQGRRAVQRGPWKINLHAVDDATPAPVAAHVQPGSADLCVVVPGPVADVLAHLAAVSVPVELGPVRRTGARGPMTSVYVRDPDGNLVELGCYGA
jgi:catechol 2,3-dioxygenase-like lactoylglutathione lyase family enzyme